MIDQDRFELQVRHAVRAYAGAIRSDLDADQLARTIASAEPRGRLRWIGLRWPASPMARAAWVLVVLALVLAATLVVAVGLRPPAELPNVLPAVFTCPAGSTPDEPGPPDQARPPLGDLRMAVDRESGRIVAIVPTGGAQGWATWTFDLCTNTWLRSAAVVDVPEEQIPDLVYDSRLDLSVAVGRWGSLATYGLAEDRWQVRIVPVLRDGWARMAYDPDRGLVLVMLPTEVGSDTGRALLQAYDVAADRWASVPQSGSAPPTEQGDHTLIAYDTSVHRLVVMNGDTRRTWILDSRTGAWSEPIVETPEIFTGYFAFGGEIAFDEAAGRTVVYSDGRIAAYDAAANRWEILLEPDTTPDSGPTGRLARMLHRMVYDPTNGRLVVIGGSYRTADGWLRADDVWAFETATKEWTQLLAPSRVEAPVE